jgi:hypothetical protein
LVVEVTRSRAMHRSARGIEREWGVGGSRKFVPEMIKEFGWGNPIHRLITGHVLHIMAERYLEAPFAE